MPDGRFEKVSRELPFPRGPGRSTSQRNRAANELKDILAQAFDGPGGVERLVAWAKKSDDNYAVFLNHWVRLLPTRSAGQPGRRTARP